MIFGLNGTLYVLSQKLFVTVAGEPLALQKNEQVGGAGLSARHFSAQSST